MNDKMLTIAMRLLLVMIGINAFLLMGDALLDQSGARLDIFYGLEDNSLGSNLSSQSDSIQINTDLEASSTSPTGFQGFTPITNNDNPIGLDFLRYPAIMVAGIELVMLKFSALFPIIAPITTAIALFAAMLKIMVASYFGSMLVRGIVGRIT